jgi:hypothetical protein
MAWPKGRPRGKKGDKKSIVTPIGTKREGGKTALMAQSLALEKEKNPPEAPPSAREKIDQRYMEKAYGTAESAEEQETQEETEQEETEEQEETQAQEEVAEEAEQETSEEEQPSETVDSEQYRNAVDRMHEATAEAANQRKYIDEIGRFVDWDGYQQSIKGQDIEKKTETEEEVEFPSLTTALEDEKKWQKTLVQAVAKEVTKMVTPKVSNQVTQDNDSRRVVERYQTDFKELPNRDYLMGTLLAIANDKAKKDPAFLQKSLMERYETILPDFRKTIAGVATKKPGLKKVPVESPSKSKEREVAQQEQPLTEADVEKQNREYVRWRAAENRKRQGNA